MPLLLFGASAAFVLWRNTEIAVLADLAYVLNVAHRIAAGDVPYAQFLLPHAPVSFLIQAALIKVFGPHYPIQIAYVAISGGLATTVTYTIARRLLRGAVRRPAALATVLALPLVPLGIYAIYPHPFYDADACVAVLIAIAAILAASDHRTAWRWMLAGALLTLPIFVKQNIGGAFLVGMLGSLAVSGFVGPRERFALRWCMVGVCAALALELLLLQILVGLDNYLWWAWAFALGARGVGTERLTALLDPDLVWPALAFFALVVASQKLVPRARAVLFLAALFAFVTAVASSPLVAVEVSRFFPPVLVAASTLGLVRAARDRMGFEMLLPIVLTATTAGTLLSQGLDNSTFAMFPLLVLALACAVRETARFVPRPERVARLGGAAIASVLCLYGSIYTIANYRLHYIDANPAGPIVRSRFPSLAGLSARGPYVADVDTMLAWVSVNVPIDEPIVFLPGEEPAFFALDRRQRLPSVFYHDVGNPYPPAEVTRFADSVGLRWVVVKDRLQLRDRLEQTEALARALTEGSTFVTRVGSYRVYRR